MRTTYAARSCRMIRRYHIALDMPLNCPRSRTFCLCGNVRKDRPRFQPIARRNDEQIYSPGRHRFELRKILAYPDPRKRFVTMCCHLLLSEYDCIVGLLMRKFIICYSIDKLPTICEGSTKDSLGDQLEKRLPAFLATVSFKLKWTGVVYGGGRQDS